VLAPVLLARVVPAHRLFDLLELALLVCRRGVRLLALGALARDRLARTAHGLLRIGLPAAAV
jgi:hypothetical protein